MKYFKSYLAFAMVLSLVFAGCSKDEADPSVVEPTKETAELSFGAILDNLANRGMTKDHFDQIPTCNDEAEPAVARVTISYDEVEITVDLDILSDDDGNFFTDYSGELEIPVAVSDDDDDSNDFTTVSLDAFMVYDGDPDDGGTLIWVAPTGEGDFTGYVDNPLPFDIIVRPGVKKYVEVEVLCFDRRMVNQYGYLFFDLIPETVYPLCFFANYCDDNGRHFPGNYGVDLSVLVDDEGNRVQVYEAGDNMPNVGNYGTDDEPEYYADPLCLVIPGPPEGVADDEPYLFYTITPEDWDAAYGDIDNTTLAEVGLSWNDVNALLNDDGETNEYVHLFINCEDDGGGNECNPQDPQSDCDRDGIINVDDECPNTPPDTEVNENGCEDIKVPGRDVVVFNDIDLFIDNGLNLGMNDPDNVRLVQNLVTFTTTGARNDGDVVLIDRGRGARCAGAACDDIALATMRSTIEGEGYNILDQNSSAGSITSIPDDVKVIFLLIPTVDYTVAEINVLKTFAAEGGRIIFVGEHDGYYFNIDVQNQFLLNMGAVLTNTGGAIDCNMDVQIPNSSNRSHPIMNGIDELSIACASVIEPGPGDFALFYDSTNTDVLAGVAKIDTAPISAFKTGSKSMKPMGRQDDVSNKDSTLGGF